MKLLRTQMHSFHLKSLKARLHAFTKKGASAEICKQLWYNDEKTLASMKPKSLRSKERIKNGHL